MKKLEKLDVLMIIFAVIVCLFALVVMYGWPKGKWAFDWAALAAIGGLAAGFGAFYAARVALRIAEEERLEVKKQKSQQARIYRWIVMIELTSVQAALMEMEGFLNRYLSCEEGQELATELESVVEKMKRSLAAPVTLDRLSELYIFSGKTGEALAAILANLPTFQSTLDVLMVRPAVVTEKKKIMAELALSRVDAIKGHYANLNWGLEI